MDVIVNAVSGPGKGHRFSLRDAQVVTLGRTSWADHAIPEDLKISGKHASLEIKGQYIVLIDLGSTNGTWYQDQAITQVSLQPGQKFVLGDTTFEIEPIAQEAPPRQFGAHDDSQDRAAGHPTGGIPSDESPIRVPPRRSSDSPAIVLESADDSAEPVRQPQSSAAAYSSPPPQRPTDSVGPAIIIPDEGDQDRMPEPERVAANESFPDDSPLIIGGDFDESSDDNSATSENDSPLISEPPVPTKLRDTAQILPAAAGGKGFEIEEIPSGLKVHRSIVDDPQEPLAITPDALLRKLYPTATLIALVHCSRFMPEFPEELLDAQPMFEWIDDDGLARLAGPVILESQNHPTMGEWIKQGWGQDAVICLAATDSEQLKKHLIKLLTKNVLPSYGGKGSLFGYCWPAILAGLLEQQEAAVVDQILPSRLVEAIMFEIPGTQGGWELVARRSLAEPLQQAGLIEQKVRQEA